MAKRIHKRAVTKQWQKSLDRNASRLARDLLRAPEEKHPEIWERYLSNKKPSQKKGLLGRVRKALLRRKELVEKAFEEHGWLIGQSKLMAAEMQMLEEKFAVDSNVKSYLKRTANDAESIKANELLAAEKLESIKKSFPKERQAEMHEKINELRNDSEKMARTVRRIGQELRQVEIEGGEFA